MGCQVLRESRAALASRRNEGCVLGRDSGSCEELTTTPSLMVAHSLHSQAAMVHVVSRYLGSLAGATKMASTGQWNTDSCPRLTFRSCVPHPLGPAVQSPGDRSSAVDCDLGKSEGLKLKESRSSRNQLGAPWVHLTT